MDFIRRSHLADLQNSKYKAIGDDFGNFRQNPPTVDVLLDAYYTHPKYGPQAEAAKLKQMQQSHQSYKKENSYNRDQINNNYPNDLMNNGNNEVL